MVSLSTLGAFSLGKPAWGASFSDAWCAAALDKEARREAETGKGPRYHRFDKAKRYYIHIITASDSSSDTDYYTDYANALADISMGNVPYWTVQDDAKKCLSDYESTKTN